MFTALNVNVGCVNINNVSNVCEKRLVVIKSNNIWQKGNVSLKGYSILNTKCNEKQLVNYLWFVLNLQGQTRKQHYTHWAGFYVNILFMHRPLRGLLDQIDNLNTIPKTNIRLKFHLHVMEYPRRSKIKYYCQNSRTCCQ